MTRPLRGGGRPRLKDPRVCTLRVGVTQAERDLIRRLRLATGAPSVSALILFTILDAAHDKGLTLDALKTGPPRRWDGSRLRTMRRRRGMPMAALAAHVGVSQGTISGLECGYHWTKPETRAAIAHVLRCAESDLFPAELA